MLWSDVLTGVVVCTLSILLLVPVVGLLPDARLDLSWPYTLADAAARHLPFGRDVVFTFGPLAPIYTRFFLPDQRLAFALLKTILVVAFGLATVAIGRRSTRWLALALPLLIANLYLADAFFLVAPWLIVPLATASWRDRRLHGACLVAFSVVLGPLLLVKGTLAVPIAVSIGTAALVMSRRSWIEAVALPAAAAASAVTAWLAVGQHLVDLPYYLRRESYIAGGYTDAMSSFGDPGEILTYLAAAAVLLIGQVVPRRGPGMPTLAGAVLLFVAFKSGFVRHDGHAMIAASTLALLGFLLFLFRGGIGAGIGLLASLAAWFVIGSHYWPVDPGSDWDRMTGALSEALVEIRTEAEDPDGFRRSFERAKAVLAEAAALPPTDGTVDLYPNSQALLLAAGRDYDPRPVFQSYSAYTPELAFLNARHLEGPHAPNTAFFAVEPLDGRYPALEDGPSWPALLGLYRFRTYAGSYAVLDRADGASPATIDRPFPSERHAFGESITLPQGVPFAWAKMEFHPTPLGRIVSMLFKLPLLRMDVTTADGKTSTFRLIAGMARAGFLLSPTVSSAQDFVALRSTATDARAGQRVTSVTVNQDGRYGLWGGGFDVEFATLHIPPDPRVDDTVLGHVEPGPPADGLPEAGDCTIDMVGTAAAGDEPIAVTGRTVTVSGWGLVSPARGEDGGNLRIALTPDDGATVYAAAERQARPDVDAHFHLARATRAGFTARVNLSGVDVPATLRIVQDGPDGPAVCGAPVSITRPAASGQ